MSKSDGSGREDTFTDAPQAFDEEGDAMAFGYGLGHGFIKMDPRPAKHKASKQNKFYYYPGFILGFVLKVLIVVVAVNYGAGGLV